MNSFPSEIGVPSEIAPWTRNSAAIYYRAPLPCNKTQAPSHSTALIASTTYTTTER